MDMLEMLPEKDKRFLVAFGIAATMANAVYSYTVENTAHRLTQDEMRNVHDNLMTVVVGIFTAVKNEVQECDMLAVFSNDAIYGTVMNIYAHMFKTHGIVPYTTSMVCEAATKLNSSSK